jgi:SAM-dependent methyltransferase
MTVDRFATVQERLYGWAQPHNEALAAGSIDEAEWYRRVAAVITPAYLGATNPRAQSGHSGDAAHWEQARELIADAVDRDGSFLDVGCASGHLMECMAQWARSRGWRIEPYGLDLAPELAALAQGRLPQWRDRIAVGNGLTWEPPRRFDFVRTGLEYVPVSRQRDLLARLLHQVVVPGGRLIVGTYNEPGDADPTLEELVASWGFPIAGRSQRPHWQRAGIVYRVFWMDAGG